MKKRITYEIRGQVERNCFFRVGKALVRVEFSGGSVNSAGITPAQYVTDNPLYQQAIENSKAFTSGEIKRGKVEEFDNVSVIESHSSKETSDYTIFADVTNMQQARAILMDAPYNCNLSDLQSKAAVKAIAEKKGVQFPNWL